MLPDIAATATHHPSCMVVAAVLDPAFHRRQQARRAAARVVLAAAEAAIKCGHRPHQRILRQLPSAVLAIEGHHGSSLPRQLQLVMGGNGKYDSWSQVVRGYEWKPYNIRKWSYHTCNRGGCRHHEYLAKLPFDCASCGCRYPNSALDAALYAGAKLQGYAPSAEWSKKWAQKAKDGASTAAGGANGSSAAAGLPDAGDNFAARKQALQEEIRKAKEDGLLAGDDALQWSAEPPSPASPGDGAAAGQPDQSREEGAVQEPEQKAYKDMLACEKRLKKCRKKWQQQSRAHKDWSDEVGQLEEKLERAKRKQAERHEWLEFWHEQIQIAHQHLQEASKSHRQLVEPEAATADEPVEEKPSEECKDIYKEIETQMDKTIAETDDVSKLTQQGPALAASLGEVLDKLLAKRLEVAARRKADEAKKVEEQRLADEQLRQQQEAAKAAVQVKQEIDDKEEDKPESSMVVDDESDDETLKQAVEEKKKAMEPKHRARSPEPADTAGKKARVEEP